MVRVLRVRKVHTEVVPLASGPVEMPTIGKLRDRRHPSRSQVRRTARLVKVAGAATVPPEGWSLEEAIIAAKAGVALYK